MSGEADPLARSIAEVVLPGGVGRAVRAALDARLCGPPGVGGTGREALTELGRSVLEGALSADMRARLLTTWSQRPPALIVRGVLDVDELPPTPTSGFLDDDAVAAMDAALLGLCSLLSIDPVAYGFENEGRLFRNVVPNPDLAGMESSWGFSTNLHWHQDNNFQPFEFEAEASADRPPMPRYLTFLALRNGERIPTQLMPVAGVAAQLSPQAVAALGRKAFAVAPPSSVGPEAGADGPVQLLAFRDGQFLSRFDTSDGVAACDADAAEGLREMRGAVARRTHGVVSALLAPGDMLVFDNYRVLHRREAFRPQELARSRWLRRVYGLTGRPSPREASPTSP